MKDINAISAKDLARVIEPEAWAYTDKMDAQGKIPKFDINVKTVRSLTIAHKILDYLRS